MSRVLANILVAESGFKNELWHLKIKSSRHLYISFEGVDSRAPFLSSLCETLHTEWQLYQMFSHKAQMGRADKHQLSAESGSWGEIAESTPHPSLLTVTRRNSSFFCIWPEPPPRLLCALPHWRRAELWFYPRKGFNQMESFITMYFLVDTHFIIIPTIKKKLYFPSGRLTVKPIYIIYICLKVTEGKPG